METSNERFGLAKITTPEGETFDSVIVTNKTASGAIAERYALKDPRGMQFLTRDEFFSGMLGNEYFSILDDGSFHLEKMPEEDWNAFCLSLKGELITTVKTYLMRWNPAISSMTAERYNRIAEECIGSWHMDWSIFEYREAHARDRFFMLREGDGIDPGIYYYGVITSEPYKGKDWRGTGGKRHYVDIDCYEGRTLDKGPWIPTDRLEQEIPEINWRSGHSGELLTEDQAKRLDELWNEYFDPTWLETDMPDDDDADDEDGGNDEEIPFNDNPGHGEHLYCLDSNIGWLFDQLPEMVERFKVLGKSDNRLFMKAGGNKIGVRAISKYNENSEQYEIEEIVPDAVNDEATATFRLTAIHEYANGQEAVLTVDYGDTELSFYDKEYALHKDSYVVGEEYRFALSAIVSHIEAVPKEEQIIHIPAEAVNKVDWEEWALNPDGSVTIDCREMVGLIPKDPAYPDFYQIMSPVMSRVVKTEFIGKEFLHIMVCIYNPEPSGEEDGEEWKEAPEKLIIPIVCQGSFFEKPPRKNTPIRCHAWLQGQLV